MKWFDKLFKRDASVQNVVDTMIDISVPVYTKEEFRARKKIIDDWANDFISKYKEEKLARLKAENEQQEILNSKCPKCNSTNIVDKFVKRKLDVFEYCHCNDCGNEWRKKKLNLLDFDENEYVRAIPHMLDYVVLYLWTVTWDPTDITSEYDSQEEAEEAALKKVLEGHYGELFKKMPLEMLHYFGYKYGYSLCHLVEEVFGHDMRYNFDDDVEMYMGSFTPKFEDILINKLGVKRLFN